RWRVIGEYQYGETESASSRGHQAALAVQAPKVLQWTPALRWMHSFTETAGEVVAGIDRQIAPNLRTSIGIPVTYGPPESHYRSESDVPGNRVAALVARLNLSLSF
ncbi:MAG: hypothetical protein ACOCVC_08690, partial [Spirochaeta sp.]